MLEFRYNGCPECKSACLRVLRAAGYFAPDHFKIVFHKDHKDDKIYKVRPDYLKIFSGGIMYNPDTQSWFDFYDNEHLSMVLTAKNKKEVERVQNLMASLKGE